MTYYSLTLDHLHSVYTVRSPRRSPRVNTPLHYQ